jgi:hypothetical protein
MWQIYIYWKGDNSITLILAQKTMGKERQHRGKNNCYSSLFSPINVRIEGLGLWFLTPLSTIFQLYRGGQQLFLYCIQNEIHIFPKKTNKLVNWPWFHACSKVKNNKYHTFRTIPKSNMKIGETARQIQFPLHIYKSLINSIRFFLNEASIHEHVYQFPKTMW